MGSDDDEEPSAPNKQSQPTSGRWTKQEHEAFLVGLKLYGREWKKVRGPCGRGRECMCVV